MLIRAIRAENFMRFSKLALDGLPTRGILGIEGPNESGKTTLGEILLFAFFGRSRRLSESPVMGLIRWGAESMSVEVEFSLDPAPGVLAGEAPDELAPERVDSAGEAHGGEAGASPGLPDSGASPSAAAGDADLLRGGDETRPREYRIFRQIDRHGTNYVKIIDLPDREEVASGNVQVAEFLARHVRFDACEFQDSFYHDQYEIRRVQTAQVAFFESATGVTKLLDAAEALRREVDPLQREFSYYQKELARNRSQIDKYERNVEKLPDLQERLAALGQAGREAEEGISERRAQAQSLKAQASGLEEDAARLDRVLTLGIDEASSVVGELRAAQDELSRSLEGRSPGSKAQGHLKTIRGGLAQLEGLLGDAQALARSARDDGARFAEERAAAEREAERLSGRAGAERRKARRQLLAALPPLLLSGLAAVWLVDFLLRAFVGDAPSFAEAYPVVARLPEPLRAHAPALLGALAAVAFLGFLILFVLFVKHSAARSQLESSSGEAQAEAEDRERDRAAVAALEELRSVGDIPELVRAAASCGVARVSEAAKTLLETRGELLTKDGLQGSPRALVSSSRALRSALLSEAAKVEKQTHELDSARRRSQGDTARAESEIRECESQAAKKEALEEKSRELEAAAAQIRAEIDRRLEAASLLEETASSIRTRTGPTLTRFVKCVLPSLTEDRYRDVRVEGDLEIKVYSGEKNDFLTLHEMSGGTNEALTLALRLAVSQALISARTRQRQFVFLDEPFKMMDAGRAAHTLGVLRNLSPDLQQFFVIQPRFDDAERAIFDGLVQTSRSGNRLEMTCRCR